MKRMLFTASTPIAGSPAPTPRPALVRPHRAAPVPMAYVHSGSRYSDQPLGWRTRLVGVGGVAALALVVLFAALFSWRAVQPLVIESKPLATELLPLAAPPEPAQEVPEGPRQVEQQARKPVEEERPESPRIMIPRLSPVIVKAELPAERAANPVPETSAPKSLAAPAAERVSSNAEATWEMRLLAHLEKHRRYPAAARARHEQGVAHVRFRMNRNGRVLTVELIRSSGSAMLDKAALDTIRRAQPLPAIPDNRPDEVELSLPVEFFVR